MYVHVVVFVVLIHDLNYEFTFVQLNYMLQILFLFLVEIISVQQFPIDIQILLAILIDILEPQHIWNTQLFHPQPTQPPFDLR